MNIAGKKSTNEMILGLLIKDFLNKGYPLAFLGPKFYVVLDFQPLYKDGVALSIVHNNIEVDSYRSLIK